MTAWTSFHLRVVTPLFSGDDSASTDSPIRVPSIRGALRYWFRAVAAGHGITDLDELAEQESEIFGNTQRPSPIRLRVLGDLVAGGVGSTPGWATTRPATPPRPGARPGRTSQFNGAQYLLGQGLWSYKTGIVRPFVIPGATSTFTLQARLSGIEHIDARFLLALWAWLTYGGLGSRVRRGFGQLRCVDHTGDPADPILAAIGEQVSAQRWKDLADQAIPSRIRDPRRLGWSTWRDGAADQDEKMPEIPALTPQWWGGTLLDGTSPSLGKALHQAGQEWRTFRANVSTREEPATTTRSPEWIHAIHGPRDPRYPIAALGLPVGYFSTRSNFKGEVSPVTGSGEPLRRASPVWLRPVEVAGGWRVFTHAFWARLLPDKASLRMSGDGRGRTLDVPDTDIAEYQLDAWLESRYRLPESYYDTNRS